MMCSYPDYNTIYPGFRRVERTRIRLVWIHAYAADRWLNAGTPSAAAFWAKIMNGCTIIETDFERVDGFWAE